LRVAGLNSVRAVHRNSGSDPVSSALRQRCPARPAHCGRPCPAGPHGSRQCDRAERRRNGVGSRLRIAGLNSVRAVHRNSGSDPVSSALRQRCPARPAHCGRRCPAGPHGCAVRRVAPNSPSLFLARPARCKLPARSQASAPARPCTASQNRLRARCATPPAGPGARRRCTNRPRRTPPAAGSGVGLRELMAASLPDQSGSEPDSDGSPARDEYSVPNRDPTPLVLRPASQRVDQAPPDAGRAPHPVGFRATAEPQNHDPCRPPPAAARSARFFPLPSCAARPWRGIRPTTDNRGL
jgi:hypothetical protein